MKVLLAIDGSEHSHAATEAVATREWPSATEIQVLTVIHSRWPLLPDPSFIMAAAHMETVLDRQRDAPELLSAAAERIRTAGSSDLSVTTKVLEGGPHDVIVRAAADWGADVIVLGSHGYGRAARAVLGSVAAAVAAYAHCTVEIVRVGRPLVTTRPAQHWVTSETRYAPRPALRAAGRKVTR
jgi:nucleotide-binding universal stress UspA family protein